MNIKLKPLGVFCAAFGAAIMLSACATKPTTTISESDGRVMLGQSQIGETYDVVMARAGEHYQVEPQCEGRKVALGKQRRAFLYDTCGFNPVNQQFADAPLAEVVYHFIDRSLVRVDVRAKGETALLDKVVDDMQSVFAASGAQSAMLKQSSYEWVAKQQVAGVRAGAGASTGNVHVRLLDESLKDSAPWLAVE